MRTTSNETTTLRRQSCDRCHNQKVRCTRTNNRKTGACDRCLRKGALCTYSSSLPKGRPSLGRMSELSPESKSPSKTAAAAAFWTPPESVASASTSQPAFPITFSEPDRQHRGITPVSNVDTDTDQDADVEMNAHSDASVFPGSAGAFTHDWASWWPQEHTAENVLGTNPVWELNLDSDLEGHPPICLGLSEPFPRGQDGVKGGNAGYGDTGEGIDRDTNVGGNGSTRGNSSHRALTAEKSNVEPSIALSQLSTRLSQLLASSRFFLAEALDTSRQSKNPDPVLQVQLGIEAVFKSINTWLVHGSGNINAYSNLDLGPSNAFDLPYHVFSASNHLLGILRHNGLYAGTTTTKSSSDASYHSSSVVHHLVLVCSTLLLNMYVAILIALQRSANALNSSPRPRASDPAEPNDDMDAASRGHLQLLSVAQSCSYFIKRQNQTLDFVISSSQGPRENDHGRSTSFDTVNALRGEVKQRMGRLQESLLYNPLI